MSWDGEAGRNGRTGGSSNNSSNPNGTGRGITNNNAKIEQTQKQVNEVIDVMKDNVNRVLDRGERLADLDERADALQFGAHQFQATAKKVKRKYWWKNLKMWLLIGVIVVVIIIVIVLSSISYGPSSSTTPIATTAVPPKPPT